MAMALTQPPVGSVGWGDAVNLNFATLEAWCNAQLPGVPVGTIVMWSGISSNVPAGWALCDGNGGRPLIQGFLYGSQSDGMLGPIAEQAGQVNLAASGNTAVDGGGSGNQYAAAGVQYSCVTGNLPAGYAVWFIIKV
jgi:hypothetical protein